MIQSPLQPNRAAPWKPPRVAENSQAHTASKLDLEDRIFNLLVQIQDFDHLHLRSSSTIEDGADLVRVRSHADPEIDPTQYINEECPYFLEVTHRKRNVPPLRSSPWDNHGSRKQNKSEKATGAQRMHLKYYRLKTDSTYRRFSYLLGSGPSDYKSAPFWVSLYFRNEFPSSSKPRQGSVVPPHSLSGAVQSTALDQLIAQIGQISAAASSACNDAFSPMTACTAPESASDTSPLQDGVSRFPPPQTSHESFGPWREPSDMHAFGRNDDNDNSWSSPTHETSFDSPIQSFDESYWNELDMLQ